MAALSASENTSNDTGFSARLFEGEKSSSSQDVFVSLTYDELDAKNMMDRVKSPKAGAVVLFAGTYPFSMEFAISLQHQSLTPIAQ